MPTDAKKRGLASAKPETRRAVAKKGGQAVSQNREHMAQIGKKGGQAVSQNREHMAEIGRKGGESHGRRTGTEGAPQESRREPKKEGEDETRG
ncbi:MAG: hypothetical protein A2070_12450 [Bdellovibrionales bacterium GWC1_52_8]|nr:MAG: hypothetical protein A2Z97_06995 [Bdellovibrionales bacterium GWB1_52_6]OFZ05447.1 MAG: hypothetical protein A2X97_11255 [Bdellovibrionales bacterium GWA1_52_35]OFZ36282.1 MAG: hypothetical protein A2070_12450 [Bdellovibrionales bacterium GWC1_52_8]